MTTGTVSFNSSSTRSVGTNAPQFERTSSSDQSSGTPRGTQSMAYAEQADSGLGLNPDVPSIDLPPALGTDTEALLAQIGQLMINRYSLQAKAQSDGIKAEGDQKRKANEEQLKKMEDALEKAKHKPKGILGKIFGWVFKIAAVFAAVAAFVAAAAATVATGGGATPALVMASMALAMAVNDFTSAVSEEAGGPAFSVEKGITEICKAAGVDEGTAQWIGMGIAIGLQIALSAGTMLAASLANKGGAAVVNTAAKQLEAAAKVMESVAYTIAGAAQVGSGSVKIAGAVIDSQIAEDLAAAKKAEAKARAFQELIEQLMEALKDAQQKLLKAAQMVGDGMRDSHDMSMELVGQVKSGAGGVV